jgi:hypothetical protein
MDKGTRIQNYGDVTKNYDRFRQFNPSRLRQYRIIRPKYQKGIEFVIEF